MDANKSCSTKLSVCNLGVALGFIWGLGTLIVGLLSSFGIGVELVRITGSLYVGFDPSFLGSLVGLAFGFLHGFIVGVLIAFVYNFCNCWCPCKSCKNDRCCSK